MPDLPADNSTTAIVAMGEIYANTLDDLGDRDWIELDLDYGNSTSVTVTLQGQGAGGFGLLDGYLRIFDGEGVLITENDDISGGQSASRVTFDVPANADAPYYIEAAAFNDTDYGDYQVEVRAGDSILNDGTSAALNWGTVQDDNVVTVRFVSSGQSRATGDPDLGIMTSEGFNAYEKAQFEAAFAQIEAVSGLKFNIVTSANADFQLVLDTNEFGNIPDGDGILGFFNPPDEISEGVGVFNGNAWDRQSGGDLENGGYGRVTIMHEILHGLGLAHPHDTGGSSTTFEGNSSEFGVGNLDQGIFTTMSYNTGYYTGTNGSAPQSSNYGYEMGPMALDIAVLQELYGANTNHKNGNTTYNLATANKAGTGWQAIWDTGGVDKIVASGSNDAFIDLRAATLDFEFGGGGRVSAHCNIAGGFTIANGVVIENAYGAKGDDTLTGNSASNTLDGGSGDDKIFGGNGADKLVGRSGKDIIEGGNGDDEIIGGASNDRLDGGKGADLIDGQKGNDSVHGQNGDDLIYGGNGSDRMWGGYNEDILIGGNGDDTLKAGKDNDEVYGGSGADIIYGEKGHDILKGGADNDTIYGNAKNDKIWGEKGNDTLNGGDGNDELKGGIGNDKLTGAKGDDKLWGEEGGDVMSGGSGADRFIFTKASDSGKTASTSDVITDFTVGVDKIDLTNLDGNSSQSGSQDFDTIGGSSFSNVGGEVRWSTSGGDTRIYINTDGDNTGEMRIILNGVTDLSASDFLL